MTGDSVIVTYGNEVNNARDFHPLILCNELKAEGIKNDNQRNDLNPKILIDDATSTITKNHDMNENNDKNKIHFILGIKKEKENGNFFVHNANDSETFRLKKSEERACFIGGIHIKDMFLYFVPLKTMRRMLNF